MQTNTATPEMLVHVNRFVAECQEMVNVRKLFPQLPKLTIDKQNQTISIYEEEKHEDNRHYSIG